MSAPEEKQNTQRQQRNNQRRHFNRKPRQQGEHNKTAQGESQGGGNVRRESFNRNKPQHKKNKQNNQQQPQQQSRAFVPVGEPESITGILEITAKGFGFIRTADNDWAPSDSAIYVPADIITELRLRPFVQLTGMAQKYERGHQLVSVQKVNGMEPAEAAACPHFEDLKAVNPTHRLSFETTPSRFTTRTMDLMAPVARGQRGLIVAPPRTGKTTLLMHIAEGAMENYGEDEALYAGDPESGRNNWMPALYLISAVLQFIGVALIYNLDKKTLAKMNRELGRHTDEMEERNG